MPEPLPNKYIPADHEPKVSAKWDAANAFHADPNRVTSGEAKPYCILIPPPNVTAALHLGHALNNTLQDILTRAHRMKGYETLWMPGTDHAGIATQTVVDKRLKAEGQPALADYKKLEAEGQPGREQFIEKVQAWKDEYEATITDQLKLMGCSCDWQRQRFTMDPVCARAVREAFFRLFKDGLIYRGKRLVNWDPVTQTALADDEVESHDVDSFFWYMKYPIVDDNGNETGDHATVATTRPETYFGDTAVAVNPNDPDRKHLIGKRVKLPFVGRIIPIIGDDYVVMPDADSSDTKAQFASGFLKVTPAHDPNDYDIGLRHNLAQINVMAPDASISDRHGWEDVGDATWALGLSREDARKQVEDRFREAGLLANRKPYTHAVGHSYRSHAIVEPYLSDQWYVRVTDDRLKGAALRAMAPNQRTTNLGGTGVPPVSTPSPSSPSPSKQPGIPDQLTIYKRHLPHWQLGGSTYFLTFRVKSGTLTPQERQLVLDACFHWHNDRTTTHLAVVMPDHVHLLLTPKKQTESEWWPLETILHSIKSFTSHEITKARGMTGPLWQDETFDRIIRHEDEFREKWNYMLKNPAAAGLVSSIGEYEFVRRGEAGDDGRDARPTEGTEKTESPGDGQLRFHPDRYAKTFETWHDNLRDWCISRQLWWGHQIPVWTSNYNDGGDPDWKGWRNGDTPTQGLLNTIEAHKRVFDLLGVPSDDVHVTYIDHNYVPDAVFIAICPRTDDALAALKVINDAWNHDWEFFECQRQFPNMPADKLRTLSNTLLGLDREDNFTQDPDVLDTWFSSALWPLSTLGWPDPKAAAADTGLSDFGSMLEAFNPTSVLTTAREIITLWVSRMVMFNRYLLSPTLGGTGVPPVSTASPPDTPQDGQLPFNDVFIHAMIQDGEGRKMSKSLGNGVDPRDIIHSHGADAMRFTLCEMTTQTQDVRMPVEHDKATGKNTSPKFDKGRNFCTKLFNATKFVCMMLDEHKGGEPDTAKLDDLEPIDRWILARLARATTRINEALNNYEFSTIGNTLYELLWKDFCDWYLEGVKPTIKTNPAQRVVLQQTLEAIVRLLHPVAPFITEVLYEQLRARRLGTVEGLSLPTCSNDELCCTTGWPLIDALLDNDFYVEAFERTQHFIEAIRQVRAQHQVPPRRQITLHTDAETAAKIAGLTQVTLALAGLEEIKTTAPDADANPVAFTIDGIEHHLTNLADALDAGAEKERLTKLVDDLTKSLAALDKRLSNPGYTDKAPKHLVDETRAQRDQKAADLDAAKAQLEAIA